MEEDPTMAPPQRAWHRKYVRNHLEISRLLDDLQNDPAMEHAEDLGDWVETLSTLVSFHPTTRSDIELEVRQEMGLA